MQVIDYRVRRPELELLHNFWGRGLSRVVIQGPAGAGKTILAGMFASEVAQATGNSRTVQFIRVGMSLPTLAEIDAGFREIDAGFRARVRSRGAFRPLRSARPRQRERNLLVLDGFDELPHIETETGADLLAALEAQEGGPMLVVTTRDASPIFAGDWARIELTGMSHAEIRDLLLGLEVPLAPRDMARLASAAEGSPLAAALLGAFARDSGEAVDSILARLTAQNILTVFPEQRDYPVGVTPELARLPHGRDVEIRVKAIDDALLRYLTRHPEKLYDLKPRQLEELMAELYRREGFEVELTKQTRDGGVDLYLVRHAPFGRLLTIVDAKRMRADRPVGVGVVRHLYGVVEAQRASAGVVATTSFFTHDARKFQETFPFRLGLQDYFDLQSMLRRASGGV